MRTLVLAAACLACTGAHAQDGVDQVSEAAAGALLGWMSAHELTGVVQPRSMSRRLDPPGPSVAAVARPVQADQVRPRMLVWVDLRAGEHFLRSVPVSVDVAVTPGTAAAAQAETGHARMPAPPFASAGADSPVVVNRGEWAALRTAAGAVLLEGRVEVLQDGRAGDRIRVRQQGATGIVLARVVGHGQLELVP
jgi:hypothetical protein